MEINIKSKNLSKIKDFFSKGNLNDIQGIKLKALYNLIQSKGDIIESDNINNKYKGIKVLQIDKGYYIGIKRVGSNNNFYPCKIETFYCIENTIKNKKN